MADLCSWLLTIEPAPICFCKPFSCKACPGIRSSIPRIEESLLPSYFYPTLSLDWLANVVAVCVDGVELAAVQDEGLVSESWKTAPRKTN